MPDPSCVASVNGVSLVTKSGTWKSRYSPAERLRILGATNADLRSFIEVFCPGEPLYAATKPKSNDPREWTTPRGRLPATEVLRHLTADMTPGIAPRWIAPHSWGATWWIGIDVDLRGDRDDFQRRCTLVRRAFAILGVPANAMLMSQTPSGGRHFRFFTRRKVRVADIPEVMERVGLRESPGQIEIFPKLKKGMRLPFGHIPGTTHDPRAWLRFIRKYRRGKFPRVNWLDCSTRAAEHCRKVLEGARGGSVFDSLASPEKAAHRTRLTTSASLMRAPRAKSGKPSPTGDHAFDRYLQLLSKQCASPAEAMELWDLGIRAAGTRIAATKRMAWHLLFVKRLPLEDVAGQLVRWVYSTGATTSVDVKADLEAGTRKVERETRRLVAWLAEKHGHDRAKGVDRSLFSTAEVEAIEAKLKASTFDPLVTSVALHFLRYAKLHGTPVADGWSVQVSVNGVIRKWPGCRGTHSRRVIEALIACGLLRKTKERVRSTNRTGRPRTFLCAIAPELRAGASMPHENALALVTNMLTNTKKGAEAALCPSTLRSTYRRSIPPAPNGESTKSRREAGQGNEKQMSVPDKEKKIDDQQQKKRTEFFNAEAAQMALLGMIDSNGKRSGRAIAHSELIRSLEGSDHRVAMVPIVRCRRGEEEKGHCPAGGRAHAIGIGHLPLEVVRPGIGVFTPEGEDEPIQRSQKHGSINFPRLQPRHRRQAAETVGQSRRRRGDLRGLAPARRGIADEDPALLEKVSGGGAFLRSWDENSDLVLDGQACRAPIEVINGRE
jgi:hypothetical protein